MCLNRRMPSQNIDTDKIKLILYLRRDLAGNICYRHQSRYLSRPSRRELMRPMPLLSPLSPCSNRTEHGGLPSHALLQLKGIAASGGGRPRRGLHR